MVQVHRISSFFRLSGGFFVITFLAFTLHGCGGGGGGTKPSLTIEGTTVTEGDTVPVEMVFTVTLSEDAESELTISYTTADGTAEEAEGDYTAASGSLTIAEGSRTASVSVYANGDDDFEGDETINLVVDNAQGVSLEQSSYSGSGTITDDDDANPAGYYTGTASVNSTTLTVTAMVYDQRILMFNTDENVLYDITFDSVTLTNYSATAQVYANGDITDTSSLADLALDGTTDEVTITGTFTSGSGLGNGSFTLTYDEDNNIGATIDRIVVTGMVGNLWGGDIYGVVFGEGDGKFTPHESNESYIGSDESSQSCGYGGYLNMPSSDLNIYELSHDVIELSDCQYISANHTGFASVVSINSVDTLVYAFANGSYGFFAIMEKI